MSKHIKILSLLSILILPSCFSPNIIQTPNVKKSSVPIVKPSVNIVNSPTTNSSNTNNTIGNLSTNESPIPLLTQSPSPSNDPTNINSSSGYINTTSSIGSIINAYTSIVSDNNVPKDIIMARKTELSTKLLSSFNGDKYRTLILLKMMAGFTSDDLRNLGYTPEEIQSVFPTASPSPSK